jgi:F-box-like
LKFFCLESVEVLKPPSEDYCSTYAKPMSWAQLPAEILDIIFQNIPECDKFKVSQVCKHWRYSIHSSALRVIDNLVKRKLIDKRKVDRWACSILNDHDWEACTCIDAAYDNYPFKEKTIPKGTQVRMRKHTDSIECCMSSNHIIILQDSYERHYPLEVIDRVNPNKPVKIINTPGQKLKCNGKRSRTFVSSLHQYNNLMVVLERSFESYDHKIILSFWDLQDKPSLFKTENLMEKFPAEVWCTNDSEDVVPELNYMDIAINTEIMAVFLAIELANENDDENAIIQNKTLLYQVNTAEPSQYPDVLQLLKIVTHRESYLDRLDNCFAPADIIFNDKYLICLLRNENGTHCTEISEIEQLLSAEDTKKVARNYSPYLRNAEQLEPGMSDRGAYLNRKNRSIKFHNRAGINLIKNVHTIDLGMTEMPSEEKDKAEKIFGLEGVWCCGRYICVDQIYNRSACHFKLSVMDPGNLEQSDLQVIPGIKEIWDPRISYEKNFKTEDLQIDLKGLIYVVSDK